MLLSEKNAVLKFTGNATIAGQQFKAGDVYSIWIQSDITKAGKGAAALIVKHGKRGARLSTLDQKNVKGLHETEAAYLIESGKLEIV